MPIYAGLLKWTHVKIKEQLTAQPNNKFHAAEPVSSWDTLKNQLIPFTQLFMGSENSVLCL
jgi:hypothetical protein